MEEIKIQYFSSDMPPLEYIGGKSDWVDLYAAEEILMQPGEFRLIPLGVAMELPRGYEALVVPRSSTFRRYGILQANSIGVIDESYCGNRDQWHMPAYATRETKIPKGARICQFRIIRHQPVLQFISVEQLSGPNRGGFGSTGQ